MESRRMSVHGLLVFALVQLSGLHASIPSRRKSSNVGARAVHATTASRRRWQVNQKVSLIHASLDHVRSNRPDILRSKVRRKLAQWQTRGVNVSKPLVQKDPLPENPLSVPHNSDTSEVRRVGAHSQEVFHGSHRRGAATGPDVMNTGRLAEAHKIAQRNAGVVKHVGVHSMRRRRRNSPFSPETLLQGSVPAVLANAEQNSTASVSVQQQNIDVVSESVPHSEVPREDSEQDEKASGEGRSRSLRPVSMLDLGSVAAVENQKRSAEKVSSHSSSERIVHPHDHGRSHAQALRTAPLSGQILHSEHMLTSTGVRLLEHIPNIGLNHSIPPVNITGTSAMAFLSFGRAAVALPAQLLQTLKHTAEEMPLILCACLALLVALVGGGAMTLLTGDSDDKQASLEQQGRRSSVAARRSQMRGPPGTMGASPAPLGPGGLAPLSVPPGPVRTKSSPMVDKISAGTLIPPPFPSQQLDVSTASSGTQGAGSDATRTVEHLCPSLLVPAGMEFVFAVREVVNCSRQEEAFDIVDLKGSSLSRVVVTERNGRGLRPGIFIQTLMKQPLAVVHTEQIHGGTSRSPVICRPSGDLFGVLKKDEATGRYKLKHRSGYKLLTFHGDFQEKAINVVNMSGKLVCATERCVLDFDSHPHYQVRIAPHVDAGLVLCGLLGIDKLEGRVSASAALMPRPSSPAFSTGLKSGSAPSGLTSGLPSQRS